MRGRPPTPRPRARARCREEAAMQLAEQLETSNTEISQNRPPVVVRRLAPSSRGSLFYSSRESVALQVGAFRAMRAESTRWQIQQLPCTSSHLSQNWYNSEFRQWIYKRLPLKTCTTKYNYSHEGLTHYSMQRTYVCNACIVLYCIV